MRGITENIVCVNSRPDMLPGDRQSRAPGRLLRNRPETAAGFAAGIRLGAVK